MISRSALGRRFAPLATYLVRGRSGTDPERVAWTASRNLVVQAPEAAAPLMQATASTNFRVLKPVYHVVVSFHPRDDVSPDQMRALVDRVLADLGLRDHQAVLVAHRDRPHPHVHVMANRVHPYTALAWNDWHERWKVRATLRELERTYGLHRVHDGLDGHASPSRVVGHDSLRRRVLTCLDDLHRATSWTEFARSLSERGFELKRREYGFVITDGQSSIKASNVAPQLSLARMEARLGPCPLVVVPRHSELDDAPVQPDGRAALKEGSRANPLKPHRATYESIVRAHATQARHDALEHAGRALRVAERAFEEAFTRVFRDPQTAWLRFRDIAERLDPSAVSTILTEHPEQLGPLQTNGTPRALRFFRVAPDSDSYFAAKHAAACWNELATSRGVARQFAEAYATPPFRRGLQGSVGHGPVEIHGPSVPAADSARVVPERG